jgi:NCS1 family nucleobase:cation symporter-1
MSGYTIWVCSIIHLYPTVRNSTTYCEQLAPITGIILADYYCIRSQSYEVFELYQPHGQYRYNRYGTNWRAAVAWFLGWAPLLGGFALGVNPSLNISTGALHLYYLGYIYGFCVSFGVYVGLSLVFPPGPILKGHSEPYETQASESSAV